MAVVAHWLGGHAKQRRVEGKSIHIEGSPGSLWSSRAERLASFGKDQGPAENILVLDATPDLTSLGVHVALTGTDWGEQAGVYAYVDEGNWVKLVVESGQEGAAALIFAEQHNFVPRVVGKVPLTAPVAGAALRLTMQEDGTAVAEYSEEMDSTGAGTWRLVPRGLGWLTPGELEAAGLERGRLELDDPRAEERSLCALPHPHGWRFALLVEQWTERKQMPVVTFSLLDDVDIEVQE
eukprot:CAMPEP_0115580770 /NCGR_PEP_ID=MMETSP0272-20121206/4802_1 /TAXON_ID=71861 /ORGANISM="Scrippsiella trochoidea, Strain CCMP3099" /LENGTH=236 /DNA_ID=CAMNT_0003015709 /DNA_START=62 /DNA_END=772 /DNA_ORIENTATION=-